MTEVHAEVSVSAVQPQIGTCRQILIELPRMKIHENQFSNFLVFSYVQTEGRAMSAHPVSTCAESFFTEQQKHTKQLKSNMQMPDII